MKWTSQPSQRDQDIYQAVTIGLRPQREVAELFGVSQGRVSQICNKVRDWVAVQIHGGMSPAEDNFIAAHELRLRLEDRMRLASAVFAQSCEQEVTEKHRHTRQADKPDVIVEEKIKRKGRPHHQMFREMTRLDEQHYQARMRESTFKAELISGESQSRWWREEALAQRCLALCRQVVMTYGTAIEAGVTLSPLPQFELSSLLANLRQRVSQGELAADPVMCLPAEWAVVARELGLVEETGEEPTSTESTVATEDIAAEVIKNSDIVNNANNANTTPIASTVPDIHETSKVVNRANNVNNRDQETSSSRTEAPVGHLAARDVGQRDNESSLSALSRHHSESDEYRPDDYQPDMAWGRDREARHARLVAA